ncbi:MAG: hypothetical protein H6587_09250 [Flavobacteriales bacterium]|nr:hypothetical protein [Flavobacteriales bacterium]MCB9364742.1 hypothetical protein [Flavobacteriales bacterium]
MKKIIILLFIVVFSNRLSIAACVTNGVGGGTWSDASTWLCHPESAPPGCTSLITILATDSVYISGTIDLTSCGPLTIVVYGRLGFKTGKKLKLADGSIFDIKADGAITPGGGGGSSNYLEIGGNQVWTADDGRQEGPLTYGSSGVLPIKLLSFEANANSDKIDLRWITSVEVNNDFFTIERSLDGKVWESVSYIDGAGNSNQIMEYFDSDFNPKKGISYYRLKQTDFNGNYSFSNIIPVKFIDNSENSGISLFPNIVNRGENVKVRFEDVFEEKILMVLRDIKGQEFYSKVIVNVEDGILVAFPINSSIPPGIYLVTASSENQVYSQNISVIKYFLLNHLDFLVSFTSLKMRSFTKKI